jgi:hypothetical protein
MFNNLYQGSCSCNNRRTVKFWDVKATFFTIANVHYMNQTKQGSVQEFFPFSYTLNSKLFLQASFFAAKLHTFTQN